MSVRWLAEPGAQFHIELGGNGALLGEISPKNN